MLHVVFFCKLAYVFDSHSWVEFPKEPLLICLESSPSLCSPPVSLSWLFLFLPGIVWGQLAIKNPVPSDFLEVVFGAVFRSHRNLQKLARCMFCFILWDVLFCTLGQCSSKGICRVRIVFLFRDSELSFNPKRPLQETQCIVLRWTFPSCVALDKTSSIFLKWTCSGSSWNKALNNVVQPSFDIAPQL